MFSKRVSPKNKGVVHENEPWHPFVCHTLGQVVCHEDIQQKLEKRVEHAEHAEEVKQSDGNVEDMLESDRRHANKYTPERIRNEQTSYQLEVLKSEWRSFEGFGKRRLRCVGGGQESIVEVAHLDLVHGGTKRVCERSEETVHGEGTK